VIAVGSVAVDVGVGVVVVVESALHLMSWQ
jgi:hypothetical protein